MWCMGHMSVCVDRCNLGASFSPNQSALTSQPTLLLHAISLYPAFNQHLLTWTCLCTSVVTDILICQILQSLKLMSWRVTVEGSLNNSCCVSGESCHDRQSRAIYNLVSASQGCQMLGCLIWRCVLSPVPLLPLWPDNIWILRSFPFV